jgi:hypothetical protein
VSEILDQDRTVALLSEALNGDAARINELRQASQQQLHLAGQALGGHLRLARTSVLRVVKEWHASGLTDEQVRWWALLMDDRRLSGGLEPLRMAFASHAPARRHRLFRRS